MHIILSSAKLPWFLMFIAMVHEECNAQSFPYGILALELVDWSAACFDGPHP